MSQTGSFIVEHQRCRKMALPITYSGGRHFRAWTKSSLRNAAYEIRKGWGSIKRRKSKIGRVRPQLEKLRAWELGISLFLPRNQVLSTYEEIVATERDAEGQKYTFVAEIVTPSALFFKTCITSIVFYLISTCFSNFAWDFRKKHVLCSLRSWRVSFLPGDAMLN